METKQVKFKDFEGVVLGGILVENEGIVICGCCGGIFEIEEIEIVEVYDYWVDLSDDIIGDQKGEK